MGNEMGNNNVSGLQEEEKARTEEDQGKFLQDDNHADELKGENRLKQEAEEKDFHEKEKLNENVIGKTTDFHKVLVPSETPSTDLAVEEPQEENETSNGNEEHDTEFKPLFVPVEIPPDSNDADLRSEDREFASSDIFDFPKKTDLDGNLLTTAEDGSKKEMLIGREYIETKNQTVDSKAGSGERDPNSYQQEVDQAEQVAEGISIPQSENGHLVSNEVAESMYLCLKPETGDQNYVATVMETLLVKAKEDEDEFDVFSPEEVDTCSQNEHNVDQSPLNTLQLPQEAPESAVEASYQQLEPLNSPLEESEAPIGAFKSPLETSEPPLDAPELPQEESHSQPLALALLIKASDSPLERSEAPQDSLNPTIETLEPPLEALESPLEASDPQPVDLALLVKASDPSLEASSSPLEASEPLIQTTESPSEDSEPLIEASKSRLGTQLEASELPLEALDFPLEASELPLEALDFPLEASESQLEAFPQASSMNSSQEVYEPQCKTIDVKEAILITSERQNGETKLANNQSQSSEENDQKFETFESKTSQSEQTSVGSDCNKNDRDNALASRVEKDCVIIESDVHIDEPQATFLNHTEPCLEEQPAMEESTLLAEESKPIESKENQGNHIKTQFCDQDLKDLKTDDFIASQLEFLAIETDSKKSAEQSAHEFDSTNGIEENCQLEDLEVNCNKDEVTFVDKSLKLEFNEVVDTMSEIKAVSTESNVTDNMHDEDRPREEIGDKEKEPLLEKNRDGGEIRGKPMSLNSGNHAQDVPPYFPDSGAFKDKNDLILEPKSEFSIITEIFDASPSFAVMKSMMPTPQREAEENIQETSVMAETTSLLFNEQSAKGQETVEKLMTEPSSDNASTHVEFRKSPSFHFDLSVGSKCDESDQTPLLCRDKTAGKSLISRDEAMFQKDNVLIDYNAPQDEAVLVEEKTIRMERSDSERPSAPFLSFLQKEESAEILVTPEKQQKNAADKKTKKDPWTVIHKTFALTSPRDNNGKRKAKSSIFSTCICCATKIP